MRMPNMRQTLKFLCERNKNLVEKSELILVCQDDKVNIFNYPFNNIKNYNLSLPIYNKPKMVNLGVSKAKADAIVILDSDRILPEGYFERALSKLDHQCCVSTLPLFKIKHDVNDFDLENRNFSIISDMRSSTNEMHYKNMFSGNTMMRRNDYVEMDESFVGYGYNDTDATKQLESLGYKFIWLNEEELHLHHILEKPFNEFIKSNVMNGIRYCIKWGLEPTGKLLKESKETGIYYDINKKQIINI